MKYTMERIQTGEDEVIVRYQNRTAEIDRIEAFLKGEKKRLIGTRADQSQKIVAQKELIDCNTLLYIESVDGKTFAYTKEAVYRLEYNLMQLGQILDEINYFRCSKSMILNIDKVKMLKSLASNRIDATMENGEHILISRTYASDFRKRLRGGEDDE